MSPAGMEPAGAERHRRSPAGVRSPRRPSQSNLRFEPPLSWPTLWHTMQCPRRESNPHLRFRKPPFYPLNYEDKVQFFLVVSPVCVTLSVACQKNEAIITGNSGLRRWDRTSIETRLAATICSSKGAASSFAGASRRRMQR